MASGTVAKVDSDMTVQVNSRTNIQMCGIQRIITHQINNICQRVYHLHSELYMFPTKYFIDFVGNICPRVDI
jgi:hypothetical protein